jgi:hypothetical protein
MFRQSGEVYPHLEVLFCMSLRTVLISVLLAASILHFMRDGCVQSVGTAIMNVEFNRHQWKMLSSILSKYPREILTASVV